VHEFHFLKFIHFLIDLLDEQLKLILIAGSLVIEFDNSLAQGESQLQEEMVVLGLLRSCSKSSIDTHV
jgi:hypothetical protein